MGFSILGLYALAGLTGCKNDDDKVDDTNDGTVTDSDTGTEGDVAPSGLYRGFDCPDPEALYADYMAEYPDDTTASVDDFRQSSVLIPEECDTIQAALDLVSTSGTISISKYSTVDGQACIGALCDLSEPSFTPRNYTGLSIVGEESESILLEEAANIVPDSTENASGDDAVMTITGPSTVTLENLKFNGLGDEISGLKIEDGADVTMSNSAVVFSNDGVRVLSGASYSGSNNIFTLNYGTALFADGARSLVSRYPIIDGQIESIGSAISTSNTDSVDILGAAIFNVDVDNDIVSLTGSGDQRIKFTNFIIAESETNGSALYVYGGNPVDSDGIEIDNVIDGGAIVNVQVGSGRVAETNGDGELNLSNITYSGNGGDFDPALNDFVPLECVLDAQSEDDGINTATNQLFYRNDVEGDVVCGTGDDGVTLNYSVGYENNGIPLPLDDEGTNQECDPGFAADALDEDGLPVIYSSNYNFIDLGALATDPAGCTAIGEGNPHENHNDNGENASGIGFGHGKYSDLATTLIEGAEAYFNAKWE